ncbi:STM4504/CBY_0614 family protein [Edaphocola aurantiacus]|uniref:STM4504/CBY_0614 family protein n=1 Tax=Edaphocola aurantiacus TaxID=2601682 RepID=UPI001C94BE84|nr:hypothetical protein [Edaphocola aurantiacus]
MGIFNLFSKRQKELRGEVPEIYTYNSISQKLRVQIVHIIDDCFGKNKQYGDDIVGEAYKNVYDIICREYGRFQLIENNIGRSQQWEVLNFILEANTEEVLDVVEVAFKCIKTVENKMYDRYLYNTTVKMNPDEAISELNERFKENGIGYAFEGEIIRIDSSYIHTEIVKPTINLLWNSKFKGANEEYLKAHEHYRHGRNKECLTEALKAFESTMKIICKERNWTFKDTDTAKALIQTCFLNELVPTFTQNQFTSLKNLLESGIPTIRNKLGGHGQGYIPQKVDDEMTRYALNLTGANIIFLIEQSGIV